MASRYNSLIIINNSDGSDSLAGARLVRFNVDDKIYYIDTHGSIVRYGYDLGLAAGFEHVLGHEIVHAIIGLTDGACSGATSYEQLFSAILHNHPTTSDLQSPTVVKFNQVLRELGSSYQRSSYLQAIPVSDANFYNLQNFGW